MTAFWMFPYEPDPEDPRFLEVTGSGDPVRSFIPGPRDPTLAELAEFRAAFLQAADEQDYRMAACVLYPAVPVDPVEELRAAIEAAAPRRCSACGLDDLPLDSTDRCRYCGELAVLKSRNLPGPRLSGWWFTVPAALAFALLAALFYAFLAVVLAW